MFVDILGQKRAYVARIDHSVNVQVVVVGIQVHKSKAKVEERALPIGISRLNALTDVSFVQSDVERFVVDMFALRISSGARLTFVALVEIGAFTGDFLGHRVGSLGCGLLWINSSVPSIALIFKNGFGTSREKDFSDVVKLGLYTIDKASTLWNSGGTGGCSDPS